MTLTVVKLKEKIRDQIKDIIGVENFRMVFARQTERPEGWQVNITYIVEAQLDVGGQKFRLEKTATLTTDPEGNVTSIQSF